MVENSNLFSFHVDATMTHGNTEIVVPVGTMKTESKGFADLVVGEEHNIGDIGKIIVVTKEFGTPLHFLRPNLGPDSKGAGWGAVPFAGGY